MKTSKNYSVALDCFITDTVYVTADSKEEAIEKAMNQTHYSDHELTVFEIEELPDED